MPRRELCAAATRAMRCRDASYALPRRQLCAAATPAMRCRDASYALPRRQLCAAAPSAESALTVQNDRVTTDSRRLVPRTDAVLADPRLVAAGERLGRGVVKAAVVAAQQRVRDGELQPGAVAD